MVVHVTLVVEDIISTDIVRVQAGVVVLILQQQVVVQHYVHVQPVKVHPITVTALVAQQL